MAVTPKAVSSSCRLRHAASEAGERACRGVRGAKLLAATLRARLASEPRDRERADEAARESV